ncbi:NAD(P)-binding domain-containing protein [Lentzea jiangxiensis]|uniref:Putative flavoprotein involved in K+ transport n=1 Tax=Lentzea jiangxiensis TaxID=641025 RepID=A0A1H0JSJ9_9PSEU|nr:NAD(P)-binding domain-containing protein [Lentzea jiangxiensis]SDO46718.1 putative flavoprotein involved in K+ transport [Lentzea jiangxiensis]
MGTRASADGGKTLSAVVGYQAGLAAAFHLRRAGIDHVVLDAQPVPGGAWPHAWNSLRLFSVARHSSLPGWPMPPFPDGYPTARHVISATGTWWRPFRPLVDRPGRQLHTADYRDPLEFPGRKVVVVGGGNSGAQIAAAAA